MVAICTVIGLSFLVTATARESLAADLPAGTDIAAASIGTAEGLDAEACTNSSCCAVDANANIGSTASLGFPPLTTAALLNLAGGLFLITGHVRNFRLCRASHCCDGVDKALN